MCDCLWDCCKLLCSVVIPPLGVFAQTGCSTHFWINVLLTLCFYFPGLIHACWVICSKPDERERQRQMVIIDRAWVPHDNQQQPHYPPPANAQYPPPPAHYPPPVMG